MKLIILIDTMQFGGAEKQAIQDANYMSENGHDVILAFSAQGPLTEELRPEVRQLHLGAGTYAGKIWMLIKNIRRIRPHLIHAHMFRAEIVAALAGKMTGTPVLFNEHGLGHWRGWHHRLAFRFGCLLAEKILCASDACKLLRQTLEKIPGKKLQTVYNSFALASPGTGDSDFRHELLTSLGKDAQKTTIVGFVGRFDPVKQLHVLLDCAETLREEDVLFILVGDGQEKPCIEKEISSRRLESLFYLPGFIHYPGKFYSIFDIFTLPSKRESLSIALLEAGGAGIPAIAFDVGGNGEIVRDGETGYIVPAQDHNAFQKRLNRLVREKDLRETMGGKARKFVNTTFSKKNRYETLMDIYSHTINPRED